MDKIDEWMKRAFEEDSPTPLHKINMQKSFSQEKEKNPQNRPQFVRKFEQKKAPSFPQVAKRPPQGAQRPPQGNQRAPQKGQRPSQGNQRLPQGNQRPPQRGQRPPQRDQRLPQKDQHGIISRAQKNPLKKIPTKKPKNPNQPILKGKLKIIPLGGLNEVGKNMTALEYEEDIIIIDMGLEFPGEDMFGVDYVIPDVSYLEENKKRIRGILITHGHLDHIGGLTYILPKIDFPPVYATRLTIGLIEKRVEEFDQKKMTQLRTITPSDHLKLGKFSCDFFRVAHSIPDAVGIVVDTPVGKIVHAGDFKFDETPARNHLMAETNKMEALGRSNVLALLCESTNALEEGHSMSEREVGIILEELVKTIPGRLIIASFSSQMGRIQQIIDAAQKHNRKIFVSGKSMRTNIDISVRLGYLTIPKNLVYDIKKYKNSQDRDTLILTTGSQGEEVSALTRMASGEHANIKVKKGDTIVISASPIIGNERAIFNVINNLSKLGAKVIHSEIMDVHTSGHGKQEELKRMINYIKPKYLIPVHGEYFMRQALADLAKRECGIPEDKIIMAQNGDILIADQNSIIKSKETIETQYILIDGRGEGQMGSQVQTDREIMSRNGALVVLIYVDRKTLRIKKEPDVVSRGFVYMHETEEITDEISQIAAEAYRNIHHVNPGANRQDVKRYVKQTIDKYACAKLERRPLIVPLIIEI